MYGLIFVGRSTGCDAGRGAGRVAEAAAGHFTTDGFVADRCTGRWGGAGERGAAIERGAGATALGAGFGATGTGAAATGLGPMCSSGGCS